MARIVPKLNLNKTPELVDNNSLIFSKNIRLNANGLSSDFGFEEVLSNYDIVGIIPYNTKFYILTRNNGIYQYDEETSVITPITTKWTYSGGKIDGECSINLRGDILLTIAEAAPGVPLKTINITEHLKSDFDITTIDESFYTQATEIPLFHLQLSSLYNKPIPAGTYQFFIRYELYENCYTDWFPASKELFAGYSKSTKTNQGGLKYIDTKVDSSYSFVFNVDNIYVPTSKFKSFQLGFIIAHDDEVYARAYKHFDLSTKTIYFDYDTEYIEEIDIKELLAPTYDLYNVGNITEYKNKLYVSNYEETDFNPSDESLSDFASHIEIELNYVNNTVVNEFTDGTEITVNTVNGIDYISEIDDTGVDDIIEEILNGVKTTVLTDTNNISSLENITLKHITASFVKSVILTNDNGGENIGDRGGDDNNDPVDEDYYLYDYSDQLITSESVIDDIIAAITNETKYIMAKNGHFRPDTTPGASLEYKIRYNKVIDTDIYNCYILIRFYIDKQNININQSVENAYTLVPYQKYKFYVHFVTAKGEITNGYLINDIAKEAKESSTSHNAAIYPVFNNIGDLPEGYRAFFISILHTDNLVAQVFNIGDGYGDCIELDTILYTGLDNLDININGTTYIADYKASYDNSNLHTFGSCGKCVFKDSIDSTDLTNSGNKGFLITEYSANPLYAVLTKCTPWIIPGVNTREGTYDNYDDLNLLGYLCEVKKPLANLDKYYSGSDVYRKEVIDSAGGGTATVTMTEITGDSTESIESYNTLVDSNTYIIYSNYNLNFLALTNNITERIVSKTTNNVTKRYLLIAFDSILLSEVYTFPSMYYSYTRRTYLVADNKSITKFTNTIRSSSLEGDEAKVYKYKFLATDYYNVPTDKGIIVNLVAVGDNILVHTQDSIYKFSGQNSLTAAGGEDVQMKESEVFDTGIQELFGSEFGYAGLASKDHQILSEFGYTFWDRDSGRIYLYTGNAQMKVLSDDISKLLRREPIANIHLADDYYNNRIFICIQFATENKVSKVATLSYDFVAKSFISVHDFAFDWHFKTKTKCYFINNKSDIYKVGTEEGSYGPFLISNNDNLSDVYPKHGTENCIVDVIFNDRFEVIKTLNVLQWVCNKVSSFDTDINMAEETFSVEEYEKRYKGDYLRLYSESCMTDELDISNRSNDERLRDSITPFNIKPKVDSYKQVRYNLGKWTFNYFRNILNRKENPLTPRTLGQDDTLMYGKYFVARFIFNRNINFKFEDVSFFISNENNV